MLVERLAPPSFAADLRRHGHAPALIAADGVLSYDELAARVEDVAAVLGTSRRLVLLEAAHTVEAVVGYLAALTAGCPVLLAAGPSVPVLADAYDPDVVLLAAARWSVDERRAESAHDLHEDLALLLSTSGSTGSPKLVRLSRENLSANAATIAGYLDLRPGDVAATTLPMAYCYGLSVLNSHLQHGAAVLLTDLSVVDPCFWALFREHSGTSLAGVPHTFDLLDRVGFADLELPSLRRVTQAGGRLAPDRVRHYAELGQRRGWDLYVMYGQTEATARMAYLPPHLALEHPGSIGRAVPGGELALDAPDSTGVGELVYSGPNVMLGYARSPQDLALGRTTDRLRTGDLARLGDNGLYEIVGRRSRISKVFGLRIDLSRVEGQLAARGTEVCCAGGDGELVVAACCEPGQAKAVAADVAAVAGLPARAVRVIAVADLPRLPTGKPDLQAVAALAAADPAPAAAATASGAEVDALCTAVAEVLDRPVGPDDTFVGLGGDSLSYVEASLRLEQALGTLPADWHVTPLRDLVPARRAAPRRGRTLESGVLLRAAAILLIVGSHADLWTLLGGAHVLLGIAGFNFARFHLTAAAEHPSRRALRSVRRIVIPSVAWIAVAALITDRYTLTNVLLLNGIAGPQSWGPTWHYWYLEVLVYLLLASAALLAIPAVRRAERRRPWGFVLVLLAVGIASRLEPGWLPTGPDRWHTAHVVFWLFALGWAAARAGTTGRRLLLTAVLLLTVPGFFDNAAREAMVVGGLLVLLWVSTIRVPDVLASATSVLAAASLHIYVTHWLVYPHLEAWSPLAATVASVAVGLAYREVDVRVAGGYRRWRAGTA